MAWAAVIAGGAALVSAGVGAASANSASNAQQSASQRALALQRENRNVALTAYEPTRYLGYQALGDLSSLYGYGTSGYTPLNSLISGNTSGVYNVGGGGGSGGGGGLASQVMNIGTKGAAFGTGALLGGLEGGLAAMGGLGGDSNAPYRGSINTNTGTVDVAGGHNNLDAQMTAYLQGTGPEPTGGHGKYSKIKDAIKNLQSQGYTYTAGANGAAGSGSFPGSIAPTQGTGQANFSKFFTSPDYQFRQEQGTQAIDRSAAARGGALSGNAIRAGTEYASNLASGEYGNYVNRLLAMAGLGQTATNGVVNATSNYANNAGNLIQQQGDARASGIMGTANSITNGINSGLNSYLMMRYMNGGAGG